jgi:membrane protein
MNNLRHWTQPAEKHPEAGVAHFVQSLEFNARRLVKSPYVIGGLIVGALAASYFAVTRKSISQSRAYARAQHKDAQTDAVHSAIASVSTLSEASKKDQSPLSTVRPPPASSAQKYAAAAPHGNWFKQQWLLVKSAVKAWSDDYAPSMGAALSYYTLFSIAPLLIVVIAVAGMVFGQEAAQGEIVAQLRGIMGEEGAVAVEGMLKSAREPAKSMVATIAGVASLLLGSTAIFAELQSALDRIWRVPAAKKESGIWNLLRRRLLSFGLVLALGFLLMVSLVMSAALAALGKWWGGWFEGWDVFLEFLNFAVSFGIFTVLFAMIYKIMPRAKIPWQDVWTGAAVTALLFTIGKVLIGLYLGKSSLASGFGAAGSLVVLLVWVYYSAQIFLLGAEYTWVYAQKHGSRAKEPAPGNAPAIPTRTGE